MVFYNVYEVYAYGIFPMPLSYNIIRAKASILGNYFKNEA